MNATTARINAQIELKYLSRMLRHAFAAFAMIAVSALATNCFASTMIYGDFNGSDVVFSNVLEESSTDPLPLFGEPISTSNSLAFTPISFSSSSASNEADITDSQLSLTMEAGEDTTITKIIIEEAGDYTLSGTGNATASVGAAVFVTLLEVGRMPLSGPLPTISTNVVFGGNGTNGGEFALPDDEGPASIWSGNLTIDLNEYLQTPEMVSYLDDLNIQGKVTRMMMTLDNTLSTSAGPGASAFIKKKDAQQVGITAVTEPIPEPGSAALALIGVICCFAFCRR